MFGAAYAGTSSLREKRLPKPRLPAEAGAGEGSAVQWKARPGEGFRQVDEMAAFQSRVLSEETRWHPAWGLGFSVSAE